MRKIVSFLLLLSCLQAGAQHCGCAQEFTYIKTFMEQNYAGFLDKVAQMTPARYQRMADQLHGLARGKNAGEQCLLIISRYLDLFGDHHIQVQMAFNATQIDSAYIAQRPRYPLTDARIVALRGSKGVEGIYHFHSDTSYTIALVKDKTPVRDYVGVMIGSKLPHWQKGLVKLEARQVNDSLMKGVLYMRNHKPKVEWFYIGGNQIGGDWQRAGTTREASNFRYEPVAARQLSDSTFYIKIGSFSPSNAGRIDSVIKAHGKELDALPNLVIDVRDNGGGSDFAYQPLLPYLYTHPVSDKGVDVLSTEKNITGWSRLLEDAEIPEKNKKSIRGIIEQMKKEQGKMVSIVDDWTDSSLTRRAFPKKVAILINGGCASSTEQFLLYARQSSKVTFLGAPTDGTLDYSNMREAPFSCLPYTLLYATTRSRRLNVGKGIDEKGIQPDRFLKAGTNWIEEARLFLEQK